MARPISIDVNPDEYNQGLSYYPFMAKLDRCNGSFNTLNNSFGTICVANKIEDIDLNVFDLPKRINEWKALTKHTSC